MKKKLYIEGMSCQHCVMHVANALKDLDGTKSVDVNLEGGYAIIEAAGDLDETILNEAIDEVGYDLVKVEDLN